MITNPLHQTNHSLTDSIASQCKHRHLFDAEGGQVNMLQKYNLFMLMSVRICYRPLWMFRNENLTAQKMQQLDNTKMYENCPPLYLLKI